MKTIPTVREREEETSSDDNFELQPQKKKRRTSCCYVCEHKQQLPVSLNLELDSVRNDLKHKVDKLLESCRLTYREKCLSLLQIARQYKDEHILYEHIEPMLREQMLRLAEKQTNISDEYTFITSNTEQEKVDPKLQQAYNLMMSSQQQQQYSTTTTTTPANRTPTQRLQEAEKILLDILPEPVGNVVDLFFSATESCCERSRRKVQFYDVEHPLELEVLRLKNSRLYSKICPSPISHHYAFHLYVYLLIEKKEFDKAAKVSKIALQRNPLFVHCLFEQGEVFKMQKKSAELFSQTDQCFPLCYKSKDLAKCYRNYGFYFVEKKQHEFAIGCFLKSLTFEVHPMVKNELNYIKSLLTPGDSMHTAVLNVLGNVALLEKQNLMNAGTAVRFTASVEKFIDKILQQAGIERTPNAIFLKGCQNLIVKNTQNQKALADVFSILYGVTLDPQYAVQRQTSSDDDDDEEFEEEEEEEAEIEEEEEGEEMNTTTQTGNSQKVSIEVVQQTPTSTPPPQASNERPHSTTSHRTKEDDEASMLM